MKKFTQLSLIIASIIFASIKIAVSQCACTNCPQDLPDNSTQDFYINVTDDGSGNCDLANNPLVGVNLNFTHEYLGDLSISLTAPNGHSVTLVGATGYHGTTHYACGFLNQFECPDEWNMSFADGSPVWDSYALTQSATASNSGTYASSDSSLLSSFTGASCGTWVITVVDEQAFDTGEFINFGLSFADSDGLDCTTEVPLSVELSKFDGEKKRWVNELTWTTMSEENNDFFYVQRSDDGIDFQNIAKINGNGTSFNENNYSYTDRSPLSGVSYYRLKQIDFDRTSTISHVISITRNKNEFSTNEIMLAPNPVSDFTSLIISSTTIENVQVEITDINGKHYDTYHYDIQIGGNSMPLDLSNLSNGLYMIRTFSENHNEVMKFIKM